MEEKTSAGDRNGVALDAREGLAKGVGVRESAE
jgi:hypothetical protein